MQLILSFCNWQGLVHPIFTNIKGITHGMLAAGGVWVQAELVFAAVQQGWISALVLSFAANGKRISRVLVACGLLYFLARLAGRLRLFARRLLTRFGEQILEAVL